jgi:hypothetical protein
MISFQNPDVKITKEVKDINGEITEIVDSYPRIILTNSHDGFNSFKFMLGLFRLVCSNGLVLCTDEMVNMSIVHVKYDFETLNVETIENEDGSYSLVFSGSLNQNVRNYEYHKYDAWFSDYFSIEIMNDRGDFLGYYDIPQGEKDFLITIDDYNPVDKITLYAYYEMSGIGDIVYNESDGEYQTLYSINSFLGK